MGISIDDLKFAANPTLYVVYDAWLRYSGNSSEIGGVRFIDVIRGDTLAMQRAATDPASELLIRTVFDKSDIFGVVDISEDNKTGFICFRGTDKWSEWVDDFTFGHTSFNVGSDTCEVHKGFLKVYEIIKSSMNALLPSLKGIERLIVSGHSLGSAVATLCALELKQQGLFSKVACWTFASPRCFYRSTDLFERAIDSSIRIQNPADVVTHLPMVLQGYRHVAGGIALHPQLENFHDLMKTYKPLLDRYIAEQGAEALEVPGSGSETRALA